jgi:hypothetical protein
VGTVLFAINNELNKEKQSTADRLNTLTTAVDSTIQSPLTPAPVLSRVQTISNTYRSIIDDYNQSVKDARTTNANLRGSQNEDLADVQSNLAAANLEIDVLRGNGVPVDAVQPPAPAGTTKAKGKTRTGTKKGTKKKGTPGTVANPATPAVAAAARKAGRKNSR